MRKLQIAHKGSYTDGVLRAYRSGEPFTVARGVTAKRAEGGSDPILTESAGLPVWEIEIVVICDTKNLRRMFPAVAGMFRG